MPAKKQLRKRPLNRKEATLVAKVLALLAKQEGEDMIGILIKYGGGKESPLGDSNQDSRPIVRLANKLQDLADPGFRDTAIFEERIAKAIEHHFRSGRLDPKLLKPNKPKS